ncbi:MAG: acetyl-CoA decarbonylase/synthase complex subunit gamma [Armatimonadota bacterium]|nr:acetyl-CoA decarbonylase/synthase complex subunit gamma [Armatimonadota bacterium]MCX7777097.1 acetyl-CoA decarbonylase/synthase complex subunit gamma [Armatimonadota bacterium]MDW8025144.1 acetyl-CoA decarbonylase/synthase complex subunit gamma [Armatimonadota bacterium]
MPLSGIEIFKLLPKKNCGECGVPTCLAFAMNLAQGKAELDACPYISEEAREKLSEVAAPPIREVVIGSDGRVVKVGGETVLFRHEKTFVNPPGIAMLISDAMDDSEIDARIDKLNKMVYDRAGFILRPEMAALRCDSGNPNRFGDVVGRVANSSDCSIMLISYDPSIQAAALEICKGKRPLIYAATEENIDEMIELAKEYTCPLAIKGNGLIGVAKLTSMAMQSGLKDLLIDTGARSLKEAFTHHIMARRAALVGKVKELGFPTIVMACEMSDDLLMQTFIGAIFIAKYGGIIVLSDFQGHSLYPLLLARMNIYTDPRRPLAVEEGIYEIGKPNEESPVLLTCNFSLTYFLVSTEIENSRVPSWLLVKDTEGLSVMTAWAGGKLTADVIAPFVRKCGIESKVKHRKLIIPGYLAPESGALEEELGGEWEILVGPREAANIPAYLRTIWQAA